MWQELTPVNDDENGIDLAEELLYAVSDEDETRVRTKTDVALERCKPCDNQALWLVDCLVIKGSTRFLVPLPNPCVRHTHKRKYSNAG